MPKANWGVSARVIDDWDRSSQYTPYDGPIPRDGVYAWHIKSFRYVAGTKGKYPQLRVGLELFPRVRADEKYDGFYTMLFLPITEATAFRYVPLLDALGIRSRDFEDNTITDSDGNITRIGKWRNDGAQYICGRFGKKRDAEDPSDKEVSWVGPYKDIVDDSDEDDESDDEYDDADDEFEDDEESDGDEYEDGDAPF